MKSGAYVFSIAVYITVTIPALRTIVEPLEDDTRGDRLDAMRILSAGNIIIMLLLGAILTLQVRRKYSTRTQPPLLIYFSRPVKSMPGGLRPGH